MNVFTSLLLAITVSLDSLSAGIIYGMKDIKIPLISQIIIAFSTSMAIIISMFFGNILKSFFSPITAKYIGAGILFLLGISSIIESFTKTASSKNKSSQAIATFKLKHLGLVIQILAEPDTADANTSGVIEWKEAVFLGAALALDSFGAGIGISMVGFQVLFTIVMVTVMSFIFLSVGCCVGQKGILGINSEHLNYLPGCLLLILAVIKIFQIK